MKLLVSSLVAVAAVSANAGGPRTAALPPNSSADAFDNPAYTLPAREWDDIENARSANCRDTIEKVREESGKPALHRDTADPEKPLLIAAVDHRIDGCSVLVMRNNTSDVRPLPHPPEGPIKMMPAR